MKVILSHLTLHLALKLIRVTHKNPLKEDLFQHKDMSVHYFCIQVVFASMTHLYIRLYIHLYDKLVSIRNAASHNNMI